MVGNVSRRSFILKACFPISNLSSVEIEAKFKSLWRGFVRLDFRACSPKVRDLY